jgi:hypothetical protein
MPSRASFSSLAKEPHRRFPPRLDCAARQHNFSLPNELVHYLSVHYDIVLLTAHLHVGDERISAVYLV